MKLQRYNAYKPSGIEWIGEIPAHWQMVPIRAIFTERNEKNSGIKTNFILSVTKDRGVIPYDEKGAIGNNKSEDIEKYKLVYPNDFVINKMNVVIGSLGISKYHGAFSHVYLVYKPYSSDVDIRYFSYIFHNPVFYKSLIKLCTGIMELRESLNKDQFKKELLPFPPKDEQARIADFLDRQSERIDRAVRLKERIIERLEEQRRILIHRAVTRGLDPHTPTKPCGIEWIGEIPAHWEVRKLKHLLTLKNNKVNIDEKQKVIALENIESWTGKFIDSDSKYMGEDVGFNKGDILFGKLRPYLAKVYLSKEDGIAFGDLLVYKPNKNFYHKYAFFTLLSSEFISVVNSSTYGTKMPRANPEYIGSLIIPYPPKEEQIQIASYIEKETAKIDRAIALQRQEIEKLKEYKASLIDSVVTGKVRVR